MSVPSAPAVESAGAPFDAGEDEVLYQSERTRIFRRLLPVSGRSIVCKEPLGASAVQRLRHEQRILDRLAGIAGVPQRFEGPGPANTIAFLDRGFGTPVAEGGQLQLSELIAFALQLASILAGVHRAGVIHKDINPANILLDGIHLMLIDYDLATSFVEERPSFIPAGDIAGTLAYIAPEQTGRTGRAVDHRSDLYAVGATLYELAAGRPPFVSRDPLQLIHDHLARIPAAPSQLIPGFPPMLSAIIMRLLEKEPDARYQSAEGLAHDLRRFQEVPALDRSETFPLGEHDFPLTLRSPSRLVGREAETEILRIALDDAQQGVGCVLVSGAPGVGKSSLINELRPMVAARHGWFVAGKFDQYRQDAPSANRQALCALGRLLMAEPEAELIHHRTRILEKLGPNIGLIAMVSPEFAALVGSQHDAAASDPIEARQRLIQAFSDLLSVIVTPARPLVMVVDDLQWAGAASIRSLDNILAANVRGLLLVCSYRAAEIDAVHPFTPMLQRWQRLSAPPIELHVENLPQEGLATLLAEMLRLEPAEAAKLADVVGVRSGGNPYDTIELINALRREGALVNGENGWGWDAATIRRFVGTGEVVDLLSVRIGRLPLPAQDVLTIMACLGGEVELDLLQAASGLSEAILEERIAPSLDDGLLVTEQDTLKFRHDRVQQAAFSRLDLVHRQDVHLAVARRLELWPRFRSVAAEQYLPAIDLIRNPDECRGVIDLLHEAALLANQRVSYDGAERFLTAALALLNTTDASLSDPLFATLEIERHAALYCLGRLDEADVIYRSIAGRGLDPVIMASPGGVQVDSLTNRGKLPESLALGLDLLGQLGLAIPREASNADVAEKIDDLRQWIQAEARLDSRQRPECNDPKVAATARLINRLMPAASFCDLKTMLWLISASQQLWTTHGPNASLVASLSCSCMITVALGQDYQCGYAIARHVLEIGEARRYQPETSQARFLFSVSAGHWFEPLEGDVPQAQAAHEGLVHGGDLQMACWTFFPSIAALLDSAPTLNICSEEIDAALAFAARTGNDYATGSFLSYRQLMRVLRGDTARPGSFSDAQFDGAAHIASMAANPMGAGYYYINRGLSAAIFGDSDNLDQCTVAAMPLVTYFCAHYGVAVAHLLLALSLAQRIKRAPPDERIALIAELDMCRDWMAARAADAAVNFLHLQHWIDAERAWAIGDLWEANQAFDKALRQAESCQRPWHRALMSERAGLFNLSQGNERAGRQLVIEARALYHAWGAIGKALEMTRLYPFLRAVTAGRRKEDQPASSIGVSSESIDLRGILRASQALSSETSLAALRVRIGDVLRELSGATEIKGILWDDAAQGWYLLQRGMNGEQSPALPLEEASARGLLPVSVFRYIERVREPVLVEDALRDDRFARDPYFDGLEHCSLFGVPVLNKGALRVILLLENRLSRGAFSADRLEAVMLISGQLGVSLDNAQLYDSLERKVAERTEALNDANRRLEALSVTDPLTGLANRRRFDDMIAAEWRQAARSQMPVAVVMIDIDQFKLYNDHYGHLGGDECLRRVAQAVSGSIRAGSSDLVARYGGEEFVIVLPGAALAMARTVAERARAAVEALNEPHEKSANGIVTISLGIAAVVPTAGSHPEALIELADAALYRAKKNGRNRVGDDASEKIPAGGRSRDEPPAPPFRIESPLEDTETQATSAALRVLMIEDSEPHAELVRMLLESALNTLQFERVESAEALAIALERQAWDIVICDYYLPSFGALPALARVRQLPYYLPFIIVSGAIREANAVEAMKLGADDYVMKNNLARLLPAIKRELEANETRRQKALTEQSLQESLRLYRSLADALPMGLYRLDPEEGLLFYNRFMAETHGDQTENGYIGRSIHELISNEDTAASAHARDEDREVMARGIATTRIETIRSPKTGEGRLWEVIRIPVFDANGVVAGLQGVMRDVTEEKRSEAALAFERDLLRNLLDNIPDLIFFMDKERRFIRVSRSMAAMTRFKNPETVIGLHSEDFLPRQDAPEIRRRNLEVLQTGLSATNIEDYILDADGHGGWYSSTAVPIRDRQGQITGLVGIARNVTALKEAEQRIRRLNRVYAVLSDVNALIVRVRDRQELFREACRITVDTGQFLSSYIALLDPVSNDLRLVASSNDDSNYVTSLQGLLNEVANPTSPETRKINARLFGDRQPLILNDVEAALPAHVRGNPVTAGNYGAAGLPLVIGDRTVGLLGLDAKDVDFFDAEEMKLLVQLAGDIALALDHIDKVTELDYLAYYDQLTGLANPRLFRERLAQHLNAGGGEYMVALALLDLDRFKAVNDALGRQAGDSLLTQLAARLSRFAGNPNRLAHLGGDHFALVFPAVRDEDDVARLVADLGRSCFDDLFPLGDSELKVAAKIGIALHPTDGANAETLFRNAEAALKKAKTGGEKYLFYSAEMNARVAERLSLESRLRKALERDEFVLHYQPKVASASGKIVGVEALIRWQDPVTGLVPPGEFIPLMEETGLILEAGTWALKRAVRDQAIWREAGLDTPRIAVNVSPIQLRRSNFVETVVQAISAGPMPPAIDLEITESVIMEDVDGNIAKLNTLRDIGIGIAIDDFGTGYSSLAYLARLPVQTLKIDRSFVITMLHDANTMTLVSTIVSLAHSLGLVVVAEGVDDEAQAATLRQLGCDEMQGYLFGKPFPAEKLVAFITRSEI